MRKKPQSWYKYHTMGLPFTAGGMELLTDTNLLENSMDISLKKEKQEFRVRVIGKALALHAANLGLIFIIPYGHP